jgi:MYXO-CTERM domain-containing protein
MKSKSQLLLACLAFAAAIGPAGAAITLLSEDFDRATTSGTDINNLPSLVMIGVSFNSNNPIVANGAQGGNVLKDQGGFGGTYGSAANTGSGARVRSSNGAMLTEAPLLLATLNLSSVTLSFDLKQVTSNYVQVVEYSTDAAFTSPVLLDTITGLGTLGLWEAKSYTLVDGVDTTFTDTFYFRIRKLRPSPAGTTVGANGTFHVYDNILITGVEAVPEPTVALLGGLGLLALLRRRRN